MKEFTMSCSQKHVQSKDGKPIEVGDMVYTRMRGGKQEGKVCCVECIPFDQLIH